MQAVSHPVLSGNQIASASSAGPERPVLSGSQTEFANSAGQGHPGSFGRHNSQPTAASVRSAGTGSCPGSTMSHIGLRNNSDRYSSPTRYPGIGYNQWNPGCCTYSACYKAPAPPVDSCYIPGHNAHVR